MIDVARAPDLLIISEGPSVTYRFTTCAWPLVSVLALLGAQGSFGLYAGAATATLSWSVIMALLLLALLVLLTLLWGWQTTAHRFDRAMGTLLIARSGPVRATRQSNVLLASVASVIDRRSAGARAIELVLADHSTLVIARTRSGSSVLDRLAREVGDLLKKPVHLARGALIADRFEIVRFVEQGGMGAIYNAIDRSTGALVALKLALLPTEPSDQKDRFMRETALLAALDHPRIARYVSHGTAPDGQAFLAMQWLEGEDLRAALSRGALPLAACLEILQGAAEAVAVVHSRGIVHRDLKPGNLFLRDGSPARVALLDFGIARRLESATRLTGSRTLVGTPHYMAPEQASSARNVLPAADIFSLGCIFYECLTGTHPFDAPQLVGVLARILFDRPEAVDRLRPGVPLAWTQLLTRMLAKEPNQRPADGAALSRELQALPAADGGAAEGKATTLSVPTARGSGDQVLVSVVLATLVDAPTLPALALERFASIQAALRRFDCPIERLADGSLLATVSLQHSATDQARIAASCALYLRELLPDARISVATGRAPLRRSQSVGDAVDRAVLLLEPALNGDGIRLDTLTAGLLEGRFDTSVSGSTILLLGETEALDESRPLLGKPTPCVGRELELVQLEGLMTSAVEEPTPKAAVILGPPGIGKSRLRHELSRRVRARYPDGLQLVGYGDPLSAGSPYVLVSDALRRHAGIRAGDEASAARRAIVALCARVDPLQNQRVSEFLGELCGFPFPAESSPPLQAARDDHRVMNEQITMAFVDWLSAECSIQPVTIVLDDVQWADALTLKLLETALRDLEHAPLGVFALGRPEAEQTFPRLFFGQRALFLSLSALSEKASELLVKRVLGTELPEALLGRIVRLAAGNALFLEELIRAAADGKGADVPETVLAMLQARLSRLPPEARLMLRAASVFGERFWQSGISSVATTLGEATPEANPWLSLLVDEELIERGRASRFPGEIEYSFRHALVCDAAYGLLADADRRAGHVAAGEWLEARGESDGVVLARHAEEAGERARAIVFYERAAEQSLGQYDFEAALGRARKGVACGAEGQTLGVLKSIQASAFYSMGQWPDAAEIGLLALELLPRGSAPWCSTVEKLMQVLPNVNQLEKSSELSDDLLRIDVGPEARAAYIRALHSQLLGYAVSAAHERGQRCLEFISQLGPHISEPDVATRGYARLWRAVFTFILGTDMQRALALSEQAIADLGESQVLYRLSLAHTLQSFIWWGLGNLDRSEQDARKARAIAEQIHDEYHAALAAWYLSVALADQPEPAKLEEAERCARVMVLRGDNPMFDAVSQTVLARVALARSDWAGAEAASRKGRTGLTNMPPFGLMASTYLVQALGEQGRWAEACEIARADLKVLDGLRGPICTDVLFRSAASRALFEGGHRAEAESALAAALRHLAIRADAISDPEMKRIYLEERHENRLALELRRRLGRARSAV